MFNILIASNNLEFIKSASHEVSRIGFTRICGIVSTFEELKEFLLKNRPNLVILPDLFYTKLDKVRNNVSFIVFSDNIKMQCKKEGNVIYLSSSVPIKISYPAINSFICKKNSKYLMYLISNLLIRFNFDFSLVGTRYLLDSIFYCFVNRNSSVLDNLENNVYTYIAKKHNTSASNVKSSIIRVINMVCLDSDTTSFKEISSYFQTDSLRRLTPKIVICVIVNKLDNEMSK